MWRLRRSAAEAWPHKQSKRAGNRHVNIKNHTHTHTRARSYSKYTHKVGTYQVVYSQRLWAQDVYQLPPDSCVGWPAVNCVSDSPLLLLIVSISVPAEKWGCCGQTQAIDLSSLSLTCLQLDGEGMGEKKRGPGGASMTLPDSASATWKGKLEVFGGVSRSFRSLLCILKWFNYGRLCIWTATAVFFFLSFQRHKELSLVCWFWRMLRTIYSGCWLYYGFCVYVCAPCHHVAVGSKYQILIWIKKKKKKNDNGV